MKMKYAPTLMQPDRPNYVDVAPIAADTASRPQDFFTAFLPLPRSQLAALLVLPSRHGHGRNEPRMDRS